jgi:hypothetical protein
LDQSLNSSKVQTKPSERDFLVPASVEEWADMIKRLISGGLLMAEAEQIIAMRK